MVIIRTQIQETDTSDECCEAETKCQSGLCPEGDARDLGKQDSGCKEAHTLELGCRLPE